MNIEILSLDERLCRREAHYPAHPEYPACAIQDLANITMRAYFSGFDKELDKLAVVLLLDPDVLPSMTYGEVAAIIQEERGRPETCEAAQEAVKLLANPPMFFHALEVQKEAAHGKIIA